MNIIVPEDEVAEIKIEDIISSNDRAQIIIKGENTGKHGERKDELSKEIIAHDAIALGPSEAARIHGVPQSSASKYSDGLDIKDEDSQARILQSRHNIADKATAKLMQALDLFDPTCIDKPVDQVRAASMLAGIVEKVSAKDKGGNQVQFILHSVKQVQINTYETIEV